MLPVTLVLAFALAAPVLDDAVAAEGVAVVPLDDVAARYVAARAIFEAVEGALPSLAAPRGLTAKRFSLVKPVDEAARACPRDADHEACLRTQTARLGARYAIMTALVGDEVEVALLDVMAPDPAIHPATAKRVARVRGTPPVVLASAPRLLERLLEEVAPVDAHRRAAALARLRRARLADDHDAAARICFELAALLPREMATWTFDGADSLADAGHVDEARAIFSQLALDDDLEDDVRIEALARSRVP